MTTQAKAVTALVLAVLVAAGVALFAKQQREIGARDATIAQQDSTSKAEGAIAANWELAAKSAAHRADSLEARFQAASAALAQRKPAVYHVPVPVSPGQLPIVTDVVSKADYDGLEARAVAAAVAASKALAAKDSVIRADSVVIVALHREHSADSLVALALGKSKPATFWSHFKRYAGAGAMYAVDDHKLHAGLTAGVAFTW